MDKIDSDSWNFFLQRMRDGLLARGILPEIVERIVQRQRLHLDENVPEGMIQATGSDAAMSRTTLGMLARHAAKTPADAPGQPAPA